MPKKSKIDSPFTKSTKQTFSVRFKELLKIISDRHFFTAGTDKVNQQSIALDFKEHSGGVEISEQTISHYTKGNRLPSIDMFQGIVNYISYYFKKDNNRLSKKKFNSDYLLGLSDSMYKENYDLSTELGVDDDTIEILRIIKDQNQAQLLSTLLLASNFLEVLDGIEKIQSVYAMVRDIEEDRIKIKTGEEVTDLLHYSAYLLNKEISLCVDEIVDKSFKTPFFVDKDDVKRLPFKRERLDKKIADFMKGKSN